MAAKMSKRDIKIKFKNGNMRLATCVEEDAAKIKEAVTNKNWANAFLAFAQSDNIVQSRSRLAFLLAAWTVQTIWSWISISDVEKDNVLELEFEKKKQSDFNPEEMKEEIVNALKDLDDVLEDILTDDPEGCKAKIKDLLKKVTVDDVEIVGETKKSICAGTILEKVKHVKNNEVNVTKIIRPSDSKSGTVAEKIYRNAEGITFTTTGGSIEVGSKPDTKDSAVVDNSGSDGKVVGKPGMKIGGTYLKDSKNIRLKETDRTQQVRGTTDSEAALLQLENCEDVTEKRTNVDTRIEGGGANSITAATLVDKTEKYTLESRDGSLTVDGRNAGDNSLTAGVVIRNGAKGELKFENEKITVTN